jgi:hypothetical protein
VHFVGLYCIIVLQNFGSEGSRRITTNSALLQAHALAVDGAHSGKQETGLLQRYVCRTTGFVHLSFSIFNQFSVGQKKKAVVLQLRGAEARM